MGTEAWDMESLLSPFCYYDEVPLPPPKLGYPSLTPGLHFRAHISKSCEWGWAYSQSVLQMFPVDTRISDSVQLQGPLSVSTQTYHFHSHAFITCSKEIQVYDPKVNSAASKLLIGLDFNSTSGGLVIFNPIRAQPLRFIKLQRPVTSISVISHFDNQDRHFFNETMMAMVGIAVVGLVGGEALILDLGLDHLPQLHRTSSYLYKDVDVFAKKPYVPRIMEPHEHNIATKRKQFIEQNELIALSVINEPQDLIEDEADSQEFHYCTPVGETMRSYPARTLRITCIHYFPSIGSLIIGFDFGAFQIWSLDTLTLTFSSSIPQKAAPVFGFSFSEPVDEPKYFCYLWVMFGKCGLELGHSDVQLHCLEFREKLSIPNYGSVYSSLSKCVRKLTFPLEDYFDDDNDEAQEDGESSTSLAKYYVRPLKIWSEPSENLTLFAWEARRSGVYYLGIFDLNQWYSSRMLEFFRSDPTSGLCPYWVAIPVEAVCDPRLPVYDVQIVPKSMDRFTNPLSPLDIHLYPASLSFQSVTVSQTGISTFQYFGVQEKLLRKLKAERVNLMIEPSEIKKMFSTYGLRPIHRNNYDDSLPPEVIDRFYLFSALLDNRRCDVISLCAAKWLDGAYANVGCTIDLILDWIAAYVAALRCMAEDHWEGVNGHSLEMLPSETKHFISYSNFAWKSLLDLFNIITRPEEVYSTREEDIEDLSFGLNKLVQYSAALLMMLRAKLLPEPSDSNILLGITQDHNLQRYKVVDALNNCRFLDESLKKTKPMMIDHLLHRFDEGLLRKEWNLEEEEPLYPPKHVGYVLNMYLWVHDGSPKDIARVIAYFLLDLRLTNTGQERVKLFGDYQSVMQLTKPEEDEILHLWLLDHGFHSQLVSFLYQRNFCSDSLPWSAALIIATALGSEVAVSDLMLAKGCPAPLSSLQLSLMSRTPRLYLNYCESISFKAFSKNEFFLQKFFSHSDQFDLLHEFLQNKYHFASQEVKDGLLKYLKANGNFKNHSTLMRIYLRENDQSSLKEVYSLMQRVYDNGSKLLEEEKRIWAKLEEEVLSNLSRKYEDSIMAFLKRHETPSALKSQQKKVVPIFIKPVKEKGDSDFERLSKGQGHDPELNLKNLHLPPQLRRLQSLQMLQSKPQDPLSPLRRYTAKLHAVIGTPSASKLTEKSPLMFEDEEEILETVAPELAESASVSAGRVASISMNNQMNYGEIEDIPEEEEEESPKTPEQQQLPQRGRRQSVFNLSGIGGDSPGPVDLQVLLRPPTVDHRNGRHSLNASIMDQTLNQSRTNRSSLYFNPGELHSIMKKEDSEAKALRKKLELRFLDTSGQSGVDEDESLVNISDLRTERQNSEEKEAEVEMDVEFQSVVNISDKKENSIRPSEVSPAKVIKPKDKSQSPMSPELIGSATNSPDLFTEDEDMEEPTDTPKQPEVTGVIPQIHVSHLDEEDFQSASSNSYIASPSSTKSSTSRSPSPSKFTRFSPSRPITRSSVDRIPQEEGEEDSDHYASARTSQTSQISSRISFKSSTTNTTSSTSIFVHKIHRRSTATTFQPDGTVDMFADEPSPDFDMNASNTSLDLDQSYKSFRSRSKSGSKSPSINAPNTSASPSRTFANIGHVEVNLSLNASGTEFPSILNKPIEEEDSVAFDLSSGSDEQGFSAEGRVSSIFLPVPQPSNQPQPQRRSSSRQTTRASSAATESLDRDSKLKVSSPASPTKSPKSPRTPTSPLKASSAIPPPTPSPTDLPVTPGPAGETPETSQYEGDDEKSFSAIAKGFMFNFGTQLSPTEQGQGQPYQPQLPLNVNQEQEHEQSTSTSKTKHPRSAKGKGLLPLPPLPPELRSTRSRSKTPLAVLPEGPETPDPLLPKGTGGRSTRSRSRNASAASNISIASSASGSASFSSKGSTPSPTKSAKGTTPSPTKSAKGTTPSPTKSAKGTTPSPTKSAKGTTPSPTKSAKGATHSPAKSDKATKSTKKSKTPEPEVFLFEGAEIPYEEPPPPRTRVTRAMARQRKVFDFQPQLSTVMEDSDISGLDVTLPKTQEDPGGSFTSSKKKTPSPTLRLASKPKKDVKVKLVRDKARKKLDLSGSDNDISVIVEEEEEPRRKVRKCRTPTSTEEDARSDISTRSTRSTSNPPAIQRKPRAPRTRSNSAEQFSTSSIFDCCVEGADLTLNSTIASLAKEPSPKPGGSKRRSPKKKSASPNMKQVKEEPEEDEEPEEPQRKRRRNRSVIEEDEDIQSDISGVSTRSTRSNPTGRRKKGSGRSRAKSSIQ